MNVLLNSRACAPKPKTKKALRVSVEVGLSIGVLSTLARVGPSFVQNRCFASLNWNRQVREFCGANGIHYQGFSLLTANRNVLASRGLARIAARHGRTIGQLVFRFAIEVGMIPLTGTTNTDHMRQDLDIFNFQLTQDEIVEIEGIASK